MIIRRNKQWWLVMAVLLWPSWLLAHAGGSGGGFGSGLMHPIGGWDHILAMVAVGIWGAQLGRPAVWILPVTFPLVMAFGAALGLMGWGVPGVEIGIALSALVLGIMVMLEVKPPIAISIPIVGVFAIFHGHAHGTELPPHSSGLLYSIGFVISTGLLHAVGIGIGLIHRWEAGALALRGAGTVVLIGGGIFLGNSLGWL